MRQRRIVTSASGKNRRDDHPFRAAKARAKSSDASPASVRWQRRHDPEMFRPGRCPSLDAPLKRSRPHMAAGSVSGVRSMRADQ
jgi:hypothetical protein